LVHSKLFLIKPEKTSSKEVMSRDGYAQKLAISEQGKQLGFLFSSDTSKMKIYKLYYWEEKMDVAKELVNSASVGMNKGWSVSENGRLYFSENGERLFFSTAVTPVKEPEDTLLDEEKYKVDVWTWNDPYLQPMQKLQVKREKMRAYLAVFFPDNNKMVQLANLKMPEVQIFQDGNGEYALGRSNLPYRKLISWDQNRYTDYYLVDMNTGKAKMLVEKLSSRTSMSPKGKYMYWFDNRDNIWYAQNVKTGQKIKLTSKINVAFYDETNDTPSYPRSYGSAGWLGEDDYFLVYDAFDLWKIDPTEKKDAVNLTNAYGRENNIRLRYIQLDKEEESIALKEDMLLNGFHLKTKQGGFYSKKVETSGDPSKIFMDDYRFYPPVKAKDNDLIIWRKGNFKEFPDLWISEIDFGNPTKISSANPQQSEYNWGTVELVEWISFDRKELQGLLYKPEDFDPSKKYPMLVYFYDRESDGLHTHWIPAPKRSKINRTMEVSNGYLVFAPDIVYTDGYPGESAYNAVVSGTMSLINNFDFIDKDRIGLNGQSWGGYQIAYMVTKTNLFKCAYS
ncbi:MAG: prolyl oligopeptidase family serine peptidase, partial [Bacteroidota bacterium]|nr:prolyl oligopeptidase family serine peptidase [Bacteroidota bacterium]